MSSGFALIFILALAGIIGLGWLSYHQAKKRREEFAAFAAAQGWTYVAADHSLAGQWQGEPFGSGDNRRAINVVTGPFQGRQIVAFDYSYQTHSDNNGQRTTTTHRFGVVAAPCRGYRSSTRGSSAVRWRTRWAAVLRRHGALGWCRGSHDPNELLSRLHLLNQVVDNVPRYVWRDYAAVDPRV